jgi:hypothetical protein
MVLDLIVIYKVDWEVVVIEPFGVYFKKLFTLFQLFHLFALTETNTSLV